MKRLALLLALVALAVASPATAAPSEPTRAMAPASDDLPTARWGWPTAAPHSVARPYLSPETPYAAGHRGVDIRATSPLITSPAAGTVHFVGFVVDRPVLSIRHDDGLISSYEPVASSLKQGDPVARGDPIGELLAGHCATTCLHFGVRLNGSYISPLLLLGGVPRAVLLPTRHP
ncbi:MAG: M23 family metallopeptidase [Microbacteriaceae bacterium]